jgi:poly(3-hydroxybutyrate) depolymerase
MNRALLVTTLSAVALLATVALPACSNDSSTPPAPQGTTTTAGGTSSSDPPASPTATPTTTPTTTPPPPAEWVPPVVATTSAACGTPRADAVKVDYTTPGGRTYHVWGPTNYDPNKTYPVVMVFHGIQASGVAHEDWFKMEDYTQNEAFVVYPDAAGANAYWDVGGDTDLVFFDQMVKQLGETYCINPSRILGYGFSYGGYFVDHLACKRAGYVKAIAIGEGGSGGHADCGRLPVLVTTRTHDNNEPPSHGVNAETKWASSNVCGAAGAQVAQTDPGSGEAMGYCRIHASCKTPGSLTYCEDTSFDAGWPTDWNHTVREYYRSYTYKWFKALP